jgi:hypothetical protein
LHVVVLTHTRIEDQLLSNAICAGTDAHFDLCDHFPADRRAALADDAKVYRSLPAPELAVGAFMNGHPMLGESRYEKAGGDQICRRLTSSASPQAAARDRFLCYRRFATANAKEIYGALAAPEMPVQTRQGANNYTDTGVFEKADDGVLCRRSTDGAFSCYAH